MKNVRETGYEVARTKAVGQAILQWGEFGKNLQFEVLTAVFHEMSVAVN